VTETHETAPIPPVSDGKLSTAALAGAGNGREAEDTRKTSTLETKTGDEQEASAPLLAREESSDFQRRWDSIQASFVDEPRRAVEEADNLVASAMKRLAEVFAGERENLEGQWDRGDQVSTEDLRIALRRYRAFFGRLLVI
jgi:hypothetical protein